MTAHGSREGTIEGAAKREAIEAQTAAAQQPGEDVVEDLQGASTVQRRSTPYARRFLVAVVVTILLFEMIGFVGASLPLRLAYACMLPALAAYCLTAAFGLHREGRGSVPVAPLTAGIVFAVGGAAFDMLATVSRTPTLALEANYVIRTLLDSGCPVALVYAYGLVVEGLRQLVTCVSWAAFLRHRGAIVRQASEAEGSCYLAFQKAVFMTRPAVRRDGRYRWEVSRTLSVYHAVWPAVMALMASSIGRWYLGFAWLGLVCYNLRISVAAMTALWMLMCEAWVWLEYRGCRSTAACDQA